MVAKRKKGQTAGVEWAGGIVSMPAYVTGEGEPYRPEVLVWMVADGPVVGFSTARPGELLAGASDNFRDTMRSPMFGRPHAPARVRVSSPELASALRESLPPEIELLHAPTPEIDDVVASLREKMDEDADTEQSYLSPEIGADAVASFFAAAADLFRAAPWGIVPDDQSLLSVSIESLGVRDAAMSIIGRMGQSLGFVLFSGLVDFEAYLEAAGAVERGDAPRIPPHFALNFERGAELSAALRKEIAAHGWVVAGPDAYPWLVAIDEDLVGRPATADELTIAEAVSRALLLAVAEEAALLAAWSEGTPFARTLRVKTHAGDVEVTLRAPYQDGPANWRPSHELLSDLADLRRDGDEIDGEARNELEDELVQRFVASPEAERLAEVGACHFVMDYAADYFGVTIAKLKPADLREILFDIIPRKVSIDASKASWIIEETRAFYVFLKRELGLAQADACLRVLGGDATDKLRAALSDPAKFGMAKSVFMQGSEAGFDMSSKQGVDAFIREANGKPLPIGFPLPQGVAARSLAPAEARAKRTKRKSARQARKKNR